MKMNVDPRYFGCPELKRFLYEYVERELDEKLLLAFDTHLMMCRECAQLKESYEQSNKRVQEHITKDRLQIPDDLKDQLVSVLTSGN